ncbi:unnamed protein product, partial [Musa acuminata var. zebrina]
LAATALLVLAHALAHIHPCFCSYRSSCCQRGLSKAALIISWIAFIIGVGLLVAGAMSNASSKVTCG